MPPKSRSVPSKANRGSAKKAAKPTGASTRNITRWSANRDIVLLCAIAKECRRDKFALSWDRIAKWVGPNITGAAAEQHVGKLYSKLIQHRRVKGPKPKKKKGEAADDGWDDYVLDEDAWGKGNEALANIFYDKPGTSTAGFMETSDEEVADDEQPPRKRSVTGKLKQSKKQDTEVDAAQGDPSELLFPGSKFLGGPSGGEVNENAFSFNHPGNEGDLIDAGIGGAGFAGMDNAGPSHMGGMNAASFEGVLAQRSGNIGAFDGYNFYAQEFHSPAPSATTPRKLILGNHPMESSQSTIPNSVAWSQHRREMDQPQMFGPGPFGFQERENVDNVRMPPIGHFGPAPSLPERPFEQQAGYTPTRGIHQGVGNVFTRAGLEAQEPTARVDKGKQPAARRKLFPMAESTGFIDANKFRSVHGHNNTAFLSFGDAAQTIVSPTYGHSNFSGTAPYSVFPAQGQIEYGSYSGNDNGEGSSSNALVHHLNPAQRSGLAARPAVKDWPGEPPELLEVAKNETRQMSEENLILEFTPEPEVEDSEDSLE